MRTVSMLVRSAAMALAFYATQASAMFYIDDTTGSPTFNRPFTTDVLSGVGTDVAYDTFAFTVTVDGSYVFRSYAEGAFKQDPVWDNFLALYTAPFDAADGLKNVLVVNDDFNGDVGSGKAGFDWTLTAGTTYVLVTTGYSNTDAGKYLNVIRGPGDVVAVPVPEPETYALLLAGLLAVGFIARRRRD